MYSILDSLDLTKGLPEGVTPHSDLGAIATGTLRGLDIPARLAQVSIANSDPVWVPALAAIYVEGGRVRLLRSPLDGGRISACLGPLDAAPLIVSGEVTAISSGTGILTIETAGGSVELPYTAGTYSVGAMVHVLRDPAQFGQPAFVLGPQGGYAGADPSTPGGGAGNPGQASNRQIVIVPQWSGSWRGAYSRWDSWNTDRYGGRSTLWQGNDYGSGAMTGLATYGDQIVGLGATSIEKMFVSVYRGDSSTSAGKAATLQPSPHGSQPGGAPSASGATVTGPSLAPGQSAQVELPSSVYDGFRTGAYKGLATVGGDYAGFLGTSRADGMALVVQYTVIA